LLLEISDIYCQINLIFKVFYTYVILFLVFEQMVCEDRGLFLEIADLVKGLGLTILKGVMETHKNKIWARFAVEVRLDLDIDRFICVHESRQASIV
jgi:hypothetical protein